ncbi:DMT family transporter [Poriferisphaera corsica]|nr:DMT family transporter [Poriferisphaera corsica]
MFLFVCVVWGTSFILMKYASVVFGAMTVGGGRVMGGAIFLGLMLGTVGLLRKRRQRGVRFGVVAKKRVRFMWRRHGLGLLVPAFIGLGYPFAMQPYLIGKYENSSFFGMMMCLVPVLTILASVVMLGVWPRVREIVGVVGGGVGIWMLFGDAVERDITAIDFVLAVSVPACYAVSNTYVKKKLGELPPAILGAWALGLAAIVVLPMGLVSESVVRDVSWLQISWAVMCILILGVVGSGIAMWMMYEMVQKRGPLFAGMVTYMVCGFAVMWGWVDGEVVTSGQLIALGVIWLMVALVQWPSRKSRPQELPVISSNV